MSNSSVINPGSSLDILIPSNNSIKIDLDTPLSTDSQLQIIVFVSSPEGAIIDPSMFNVSGTYRGSWFYVDSGVSSFIVSPNLSNDSTITLYASRYTEALSLNYSLFNSTETFLSTISVPMNATANLSNLGGVLFTSLQFVLPLVAAYFAFRYIYNKVRKRFRGAGV